MDDVVSKISIALALASTKAGAATGIFTLGVTATMQFVPVAGQVSTPVVVEVGGTATSLLFDMAGLSAITSVASNSLSKMNSDLADYFHDKSSNAKVKNTPEGGLNSEYYHDATGKWHRPNGEFASNAEMGLSSSSEHY